jgi:hypothetical protein
MRTISGFAVLLLALGIGYYIYSQQVRQASVARPLVQQNNLIGIRSDLLSIAQAERLYMAANGRYGIVDELRRSGYLNHFPEDERRGYRIVAEPDGASHFRVTATPVDLSRTDLPLVSIDETLQILQ